MKIIVLHNAYQHAGGEDAVVDSEVEMLRNHGNEVELLKFDNASIKSGNLFKTAVGSFWSFQSAKVVEEVIQRFSPEVIHIHNTWPLISPSVIWLANKYRIPVVQTLHNFRIICPQGMLLKDGVQCEKCIDTFALQGIVSKCYRDSYLQSAVLAFVNKFHQYINTYSRRVDRLIVLSNYSRSKFLDAGFPVDKLVIKPNFVAARNDLEPVFRRGALYVGRLSPEKGIGLLLNAYSKCSFDIKVIGDGPLRSEVEQAFKEKYLGYMKSHDVMLHINQASYLLVPSICAENFPRAIVESFSTGVPVIASNFGSMAEIVDDGVTGLLFEHNNANDLLSKIRWAELHPDEMMEMGKRAKQRYLARYTEEINYRFLMDIYQSII